MEARLDSGLLVVRISLAQSLGPVVKGIAERLVDALESLVAGHEDLDEREVRQRPKGRRRREAGS